jgi:exonuclease III
MGQNFAVLRIDYMFSSPNVSPLATSVDCTPRGSDHCIVHGEFEIK